MTKKILLIDDDEELCNEMAEIFKDEGYSVETAFNGLEGKSKVEKNKYNFIVLDYRMPGLNGIEVLKIIKQINIKTKVFMASGLPFIEKLILNENLSDMIEAILPKPYPFELLLEKIKKLS